MCRFGVGDSCSCTCPWTLIRAVRHLQQRHVGQQQRRVARRVQRHRCAVALERADLIDRVDVVIAENEPLCARRLPPPFLVVRQGLAVDGDVA